MSLSKLLTIFATVLLIQAFANDLVDLSSLDICNEGALQFHDSQFALGTVELIKSRLIKNTETKMLLLATPYELEKAKAKLLRCTEELMRQNQFKAIEKLIEDVLDPLDLDLSNDLKLIGSQIKKEIDNLMNLAYAKRHTQTVSPAFQWIQSRSNILLQIKFAHRHDAPGCLEVKNEKIHFSENAMNFSAFGIQAQLPIQFLLNLAFYKDIVPEQSSWKLESVGRMFVNITKAVPKVWVSLLKDDEKLPQMRFWWEMKDNFKSEMKEYEKLLEEQEEGEKKKKPRKKKRSDKAPEQFDDNDLL